MESSIIRQREEEADWGRVEGGGLSGQSSSQWAAGGRRGHGEARYESHRPGMCYVTSALCRESVSGKQKRVFLGRRSQPPPRRLIPSLWVLSKRSDTRVGCREWPSCKVPRWRWPALYGRCSASEVSPPPPRRWRETSPPAAQQKGRDSAALRCT